LFVRGDDKKGVKHVVKNEIHAKMQPTNKKLTKKINLPL
jgi:hypothetical protein